MIIKLVRRYKKNFLVILYLMEAITLLLGISLPLVQIDELWIFSSEFSLISVTIALFKAEEFALSLLLICFGFFIPVLKMVSRILEWTSVEKYNLQKLAMVDIFMLSLLIFSSKASSFFEIVLREGSYFLIVHIVLSYWISFIRRNYGNLF